MCQKVLSKTPYFLGIDGGGTKTEFLLTDGKLNEIKRIKKSASNPAGVGIDATLGVLGEGLSEIACDIPCGDIAVFAGIAGILRGNSGKTVQKFLGQYGFYAFGADTDCFNAYKAAFPAGGGVCAIMGTGTSVFYMKNGELKILGGLGYLLDRFGSGYDIGAMGLRVALLCEQGAGPETLIREIILEKEGKDALLPELLSYYSSEWEKIASYSECVFKAFENGDCVALDIVRENVKRAA